MRVLFTTTGHSGHLLPLVPLARACERAGHEVLVVVHTPRVDAVQRAGLRAHPVDPAPDEAWRPLLGRIAALGQAEGDALIIGEGFARVGGGSVLPAVLDVVRAWRPDALVHECYEFAGPVAAERLGVACARVALGLASTEAWVDALAAGTVADLRRDAGLPPDPTAPPAALLSVVPPGLDDGFAHRFRDGDGGGRGDGGGAPAGDPLVYVTLGSVAGSLPFFPDLYRAVLDALAPVPARILLTLGRDADPAALGPVAPAVRVEAWVDQREVLARCAAVVGHGGFGTTLGALAHGVPLVQLPLFAGDQWRNAARVAAVGAGLSLEDGERRVFDPPPAAVLARLPDAIAALRHDPSFRARAASLAAETAALPPADAAVDVLSALARGGRVALSLPEPR